MYECTKTERETISKQNLNQVRLQYAWIRYYIWRGKIEKTWKTNGLIDAVSFILNLN